MRWKDLISIESFCIYFLLFNILDIITTYYGVFILGLFEANSFARLLFDNGMFKMAILIKFLVVLLASALLWFAHNYHKLNYQINQKKLDKFHMNLYYYAMVFVTALFIIVVINNTVWIVKVLYG